MVKPNCLSRALDQWNEDKSMRLWCNQEDVMAINESKPYYWKFIKEGYVPVELWGTLYFMEHYKLSMKHLKLLGEYFNSLSNTKIK